MSSILACRPSNVESHARRKEVPIGAVDAVSSMRLEEHVDWLLTGVRDKREHIGWGGGVEDTR